MPEMLFSFKFNSEKSEMASHPVGEISFLVCVQGYVHVPTHHWSVLLLFHTGKKIIPRQSFSPRTHTNIKSKTLYLRTSFSCLQLHQFWLPVTLKLKKNKSIADNHLELSFHFFYVEKCCVEAVRGRKWSGGGGNRDGEKQKATITL